MNALLLAFLVVTVPASPKPQEVGPLSFEQCMAAAQALYKSGVDAYCVRVKQGR